jgi:hypothetical protein
LGVASSRSAGLLTRNYQATAREALRAAESDLAMARAAGASAEVMFDLETALRDATRATQNELAIRQQLGNISGEAIQDIMDLVEQEIQNARTQAEALLRSTPAASGAARTDQEITTELRAGEADRRRQAYETAATSSGINLTGLVNPGNDVARVFQVLARDATTLSQMENRYRETRRAVIDADLRAGRITVAQAQEHRRAIEDEIRARRRAIAQSAESRRERGPAAEEERSNAFALLGGSIITVGQLIANNLDVKSSAGTAALAAGLQSGSQTAGMGIALIGEIRNLRTSFRNMNNVIGRIGDSIASFAGRIAVAGTLVATLASGAKEAVNAYKLFSIELGKSRIDASLDRVRTELDKLSKTINKFDLTTINQELIRASNSFANTIELMQTRGLIQWANIFDAIRTYLPEWIANAFGGQMERDQFSELALILEKGGFAAYARASTGVDARRGEMGRVIPDIAREQAAMGKGISDSISEVLTERFKRG